MTAGKAKPTNMPRKCNRSPARKRHRVRFVRALEVVRVYTKSPGKPPDTGTPFTVHRGDTVLDVSDADNMIENVIGVFGLPLAVAPNFLVDGKD